MKKKYIYMYHRYDDVSKYILENRERFGYKVIIHDPMHCGFTIYERNMADKISCWSDEFIRAHINDNNEKMFTLFLPSTRVTEQTIPENLLPTEPYIVAIGNLFRDFNILIDALDGINLKCVILTSMNIKLIKEHGTNVIIQTVPSNLVNYYIRGAMFGVLPLVENIGLGGGLNAQAHGCTVASQYVQHDLPFIASDNMGVNEYLMDGVFGETYPVNDKNVLREKIIRFMDGDVQLEYRKKIDSFYEESPDFFSAQTFLKVLAEQFENVN